MNAVAGTILEGETPDWWFAPYRYFPDSTDETEENQPENRHQYSA